MSAAGIIFSNVHDTNISELTSIRTMASVPFGCRYRLIDFTLSNMVNSNIHNISVITHYNYRSLMDHIGSGKDWDLARRSGGIKFFPPLVTMQNGQRSASQITRLDALKNIHSAITRIKDDYVVLSDCDVICNIDLNDIINDHIESGADMTFAVKQMEVRPENAERSVLFESDNTGRITDVIAYPKSFSGTADVNLNIIVTSKEYLQEIVESAIAHNYTSLTKDIIARCKGYKNYRVYKYNGYFACFNSLEEYYMNSMTLISDPEARNELFNVRKRPIFTKVRNSPPTYYSETSKVKNSLIADGCVIHGNVENSILFRGVKVGKNTTIKNSILFQDVFTGENVTVNCVIADKNVVLRDSTVLSGHETMPFYISKGKMI